jgi:hypothetical protein
MRAAVQCPELTRIGKVQPSNTNICAGLPNNNLPHHRTIPNAELCPTRSVLPSVCPESFGRNLRYTQALLPATKWRFVAAMIGRDSKFATLELVFTISLSDHTSVGLIAQDRVCCTIMTINPNSPAACPSSFTSLPPTCSP